MKVYLLNAIKMYKLKNIRNKKILFSTYFIKQKSKKNPKKCFFLKN